MEQEILEKLKKTFLLGLKTALAGQKKVAIIYSGGIDSSLVAFTAHKLGAEITTFTAGTKDSPDVQFINSSPHLFPFETLVRIIDKETLRLTVPKVEKILEKTTIDTNLMQTSLGVGLFLVLEEIKKIRLKLALSGQAADELFAGYFRALKLEPAEINPACRKELKRLKNSDAKREKAIADHFKIKINYPYLDSNFVKLALKIPPRFKLKKSLGEKGRKYILRKLALEMGVPEKIALRPKKAWQYSSRIQREIRKIVKS